MGATFTQILVRSKSLKAIRPVAEDVVPVPATLTVVSSAWMSLALERAETIEDDVIDRVSAFIAAKADVPVLAFRLFDSDVIAFRLFDLSGVVANYNSCPGYFDGNVYDITDYEKAAVTHAVLGLCPNKVTAGDIDALLYPDEHETFMENTAFAFYQLLGIDPERAVVGGPSGDDETAASSRRSKRTTTVTPRSLDPEYWNFKLIAPLVDDAEFRLALANGADPNFKHYGWYTPLCYHVGLCHIEHIRALLEYGADPNSGPGRFHDWMSPSYDGDYEVMAPLSLIATQSRRHHPTLAEVGQLLIDFGADVHARSSKGRTALGIATEMSDPARHIRVGGYPGTEETRREAAQRCAELCEVLRAAGADG